MHTFLANNRAELIERCRAKVAMRPRRAAAVNQLETGIPMFLDQLERTLAAEENGQQSISERISGKSGGDTQTLSEIGLTAMAHGRLLLDLDYTIDQVVHDYGDLCQAITDLAVEQHAPFDVEEFRTLNRCLDNAIADATTGYSLQRDAVTDASANERLGFLVHELRNALNTASLAVSALERGSLPIAGATGGVLKRAHVAMKSLIDAALNDVRRASPFNVRGIFAVAGFIEDSAMAAALYATASGCTLVAPSVDLKLMIQGNRGALLAALANVLQNAFKFTRPGTEVLLQAAQVDGAIQISVRDHCGGLPAGDTSSVFVPFTQLDRDREGLGLGLSIARHNVEADGGTIHATDVPGEGCVFTISLPSYR